MSLLLCDCRVCRRCAARPAIYGAGTFKYYARAAARRSGAIPLSRLGSIRCVVGFSEAAPVGPVHASAMPAGRLPEALGHIVEHALHIIILFNTLDELEDVLCLFIA